MSRKEPTSNDNNLAIAYYRFSSHAQNEASIDQQREAAKRYAEGKGLTIVKEYEDRAISGTTDERPGFQRMLAEIGKVKPAALIMWKTDRLGRDRYTLALAKKTIRDAGCKIHLVAEAVPEDSPEAALMEGLLESMAEFYSKQLRQNITRGMRYNAENALYNGIKMLGYKVGPDKRYVIDEATAPVVQRIFDDYTSGKPLQTIARELNEQGVRSIKGTEFTINSLRAILHNKAYIGIYRFSDIVIENGMPALVTKEQFEAAQARFALNKRKGAQIANSMSEEDTPRYWLTGHLYCGHCGESMQGVSGTSRTGAKHYYYYCAGQRRRRCKKKPIKKKVIEQMVAALLKAILQDAENRASLAVDAAEYYKRYHTDTGYLEGLEAELKETQKSLNNLIRAIEQGIFSDTTQERLTELESRKKALGEAIETEKIKRQLTQDEYSIQKYYDEFADADLDNPETREMLLDYFIDKIYVYDDHIKLTGWFSYDRQRLGWQDLNSVTVEFNTFALSSTRKTP